jgi:hypothetical protein
MRYAPGVLAAVLLLTVTGAASAQVRTAVRAQTVYESYSFDPGFTFEKVSEFAIPVGVDLSFGRRADLTLSTGYVRLDVQPEGDFDAVSGLIDTELRLGINLIPGRLIAVFTGVIPTGVKVDSANASVLTPIASDVIGFAIPTLGMGASVGGGLVGALPMGKFAFGAGLTAVYPFGYEPFQNSTTQLAPGGEIRGRLGVEGPLAKRTYLRVAGVFAARGKDEFGDVVQSGVGQRYVGYAEVSQGIGKSQLTLYGFDVYRGAPSIEGPAVLPKGNLIAAGLRHAIPVTSSFSVAPRAEWRMSTAAPVTSTDADGTPVTFGALRKVGSSLRLALDMTQALARGVAVTGYGSWLTGDVRPDGVAADVPLDGWRGGLTLTFTR